MASKENYYYQSMLSFNWLVVLTQKQYTIVALKIDLHYLCTVKILSKPLEIIYLSPEITD